MLKSIKIIVLAAGLMLGACNNSKKSDMKTQENNHDHLSYSCPMHPEVTGKQGDTCPKCGMELASETANEPGQNEVQLITAPGQVKAGSAAELKYTFSDAGRPLELEVSHEKKIHLIAVSDDLAWFRHIHPKEQKDGSYVISEIFPHGGKYLLFADYKPAGKPQIVDKQEIEVTGVSKDKDVFASVKTISNIDGYKVTLENGNDLKTNRTQALKVSVEKDGRKISAKDIEKYLGATAHIVMIGRADRDFLHIHPLANDRYPIYAETHIKKPGAYRIWVEFQTNGKVHTADFTVNVAKGDARAEKQSHGHAGHEH